MTLADIINLIRDVPDFPKPGVMFKDITPLLANARGFSAAILLFAERIKPYAPDALIGIESRGFIFASALALQLDLPLQLARKPGKLPYQTIAVSYELEYGHDAIEMHVDAISPGKRYLIVDDLIATGGTLAACASLVKQQQGHVACCAALIELVPLQGRKKLTGYPVESLIEF